MSPGPATRAASSFWDCSLRYRQTIPSAKYSDEPVNRKPPPTNQNDRLPIRREHRSRNIQKSQNPSPDRQVSTQHKAKKAQRWTGALENHRQPHHWPKCRITGLDIPCHIEGKYDRSAIRTATPICLPAIPCLTAPAARTAANTGQLEQRTKYAAI